ncbi:C4-dicarboxylate ABC transporter [Haematobacter massiliensis]|uniref:TRAP transporter substrate-binding protein DctP n=1 Tax=Haematobacter massiliensis TaxID=195105 RepID=UPI000B497C68|nr:TRAP transporter substrate-binding protein DctP [Haematobacter massiliensis]OWJ69440.1 C4-dicarboxylate ABC transporter [Haematobacter massiliensis]QBJ25472.1 C4-dicarboxylate ABC transporter [Haematobacter massiliensis]
MTKVTRRGFAALGGAMLATPFLARLSHAAEQSRIRFSAVFSEQDIRAGMMKQFAEGIGPDFKYEGFYGGTLFKQGTELVALQRGNLEMSNIAPQDISNQIPAWSILTSGYLFRDPDHLRSFFTSDVGAEMKALAEGQLGIKILGPTFYGTRQVGLRGNRKIATPADMAGVKLRMPGGEAWQFLGRALGANPTPMAYAEVYTGLQTGAIDGQDNPLPNVDNMKFYEVMDQIVLTSHLVAFDLLTVSGRFWEKLTEEQRAAFQTAADGAIGWSTEQHVTREAEIAKSFAERGLDVYAPDLAAFRSHVQKAYLESDLAKEWPAGMIERIAAA